MFGGVDPPFRLEVIKRVEPALLHRDVRPGR
jgi:hypothetical protein